MVALVSSFLTLGGFRPTGNPYTTNFGLYTMGFPGESWPMVSGRPYLFVCQLNLTETTSMPDCLHDLQLITLFIDPNFALLGEENGNHWQLRAYSSLEGLVKQDAPVKGQLARGFECIWQTAKDYPADQQENINRTKIGGYPSDIQSAPWWESKKHPVNPQFCLQVVSEAKVHLSFGDGGTLFFARGKTDTGKWFLDFQDY
jgi:uncharacterized protein YwqG